MLELRISIVPLNSGEQNSFLVLRDEVLNQPKSFRSSVCPEIRQVCRGRRTTIDERQIQDLQTLKWNGVTFIVQYLIYFCSNKATTTRGSWQLRLLRRKKMITWSGWGCLEFWGKWCFAWTFSKASADEATSEKTMKEYERFGKSWISSRSPKRLKISKRSS